MDRRRPLTTRVATARYVTNHVTVRADRLNKLLFYFATGCACWAGLAGLGVWGL